VSIPLVNLNSFTAQAKNNNLTKTELCLSLLAVAKRIGLDKHRALAILELDPNAPA